MAIAKVQSLIIKDAKELSRNGTRRGHTRQAYKIAQHRKKEAESEKGKMERLWKEAADLAAQSEREALSKTPLKSRYLWIAALATDIVLLVLSFVLVTRL
jgi:hypothetical protein